MSNPIRDFSTNEAIGDCYHVYMAIRADLAKKNIEDKQGNILKKYMNELGINLYPGLMRLTTNSRYIDACGIYKYPQKNE
jgi:DNA-directed RNA polymerase subunit N (RpoN/RPB10)